jgi:hypothetical protein
MLQSAAMFTMQHSRRLREAVSAIDKTLNGLTRRSDLE